MPDIPRSQLVAYAVAALVIVAIGARYLGSRGGEAAGGAAVPVRVSGGEAGGARSGGWLVVQVAGEVHRPGVYRVRAGQRVDDAVRVAGGPTARAELSGVNLAAKVEDGRQVIVPARAAAAGAGGAAGGAGGAVPAGTAPAGPAPAGTAAAGTAAAGASAPLNLNTATVEQLDQLDGIGPATAQKIVAYRQAHGGFRSVSELDHVPGIGPGRLAAIRDRVTV